MCTLIVGLDVAGAGSRVIAANRDEDPARPSDPPGILRDSPRVAGGRDRVSGGTWLAVRADGLVVAILNRRSSRDPAVTHAATAPAVACRSRGLLALDLAVALPAPGADDFAEEAIRMAAEALGAAAYEGCSLALLGPRGCVVVAHDPGAAPAASVLTAGWHVITHADLDDASEPRTAWLLGRLAEWTPGSWEHARPGLTRLLATHGDETAGVPAVCLHAGRMVTVSSSLLHVTAGATRYLHVEGRPCRDSARDCSALLQERAGNPLTHDAAGLE